MANEIGSFAEAAATTSNLPPDNAGKPAPKDPIIEKPVEKPVAEKPVTEKPVEKAAEKPAPEKPVEPELSNPHLAESKSKEKAAEVDANERPAGMTDKAYVSWKKIRESEAGAVKERDAAKEELTKIKEQLDQASKLTPELEAAKKELKELQTKLAEYEGEINITRVEATKAYKERVSGPTTEILTGIEETAKRYEIPPETLLRAIQEPDAAKRAELIDTITEDFKRSDQVDVVQSAKDYHRLQKVGAEMRGNASKQLEELTREQKQEQERASASTLEDYRNAVAEQWSSIQNAIPVIRSVEGNDAWNAHLSAIARRVESIDVNNLPVEEVAKMAVYKEAMPEVLSALTHFQKENVTLKEKLAEAEGRIKDYRGTTPAAGGGNNGNGAAAEKKSGLFADIVV